MIKNIENSMKIGNWKPARPVGGLKIILLALSVLIFMPKAASAALILQAPKYIGLDSGLAPLEIQSAKSRLADASCVLSLTGLVGYWSFDPVRDLVSDEILDMIYSSIKRVPASAVSFRISNGVDGKDMAGNMENLSNKS